MSILTFFKKKHEKKCTNFPYMIYIFNNHDIIIHIIISRELYNIIIMIYSYIYIISCYYE
jgi:hypothetical protein